MADWFRFNGAVSTSLGVYVTTYPPITLPEERVEFKPVPGRSGSLTITEGEAVYDDITLSVECLMKDLSKLDQMNGWLRGRGELVLGNRPDSYYNARVVNQIELEKIVRGRPHRSFAVVFRCAPYRYQINQYQLTYAAQGDIINPGNIYSEPVIVVTGKGDIDLTIGGNTLHIGGVDGNIVIDAPARLAYKGTVNQCFKLTGDWPMLPVGRSAVSWTGNVSEVAILPNWRNL